jgi:hypothetical protein
MTKKPVAPTYASYWLFCKWSMMAAAIFWMMIYMLSEKADKLPNFVYVNF